MKKIYKKMTVLAILVGLFCATSYAKGIGDIISSKLKSKVPSAGGVSEYDEWRNVANDYLSKKQLEGIDFFNDGTCNIWDGSPKGQSGTWKGGLSSGDKVSVTVGSKTISGTIKQDGSALVVTLGEWGTLQKPISIK